MSAPEEHFAGTAAAAQRGLAKLWPRGPAPSVAPDDPAMLIITDFAREQVWTASEERSIDDALCDMMCAGVRALLVMRDDVVTGLITSYDIEGRRPPEYLQADASGPPAVIQVGHIMTPWDLVPTLEWRSVCALRVRQLEEWAGNTRATHALIVEQRDSLVLVRGLLSRTRLERAVGRPRVDHRSQSLPARIAQLRCRR